jgi:hypothetical protein
MADLNQALTDVENAAAALKANFGTAEAAKDAQIASLQAQLVTITATNDAASSAAGDRVEAVAAELNALTAPAPVAPVDPSAPAA